jgi:hypothetical protein
MITNDGREACEIKSKIKMAKTALNKKTFSPKFWSNFKELINKVLHLQHGFVWC